eukprot:6344226-Pyramimonas_sp.AAC.1
MGIASSAQQIVGEALSRPQIKRDAAYAGAMLSSLLAAPVARAEDFELWVQGASPGDLAVEAGFLIAFMFLVVLTGGVGNHVPI